MEGRSVRRANAAMNVKKSVMAVEIQLSEDILAIEKAQWVCYRCGIKEHFLNSCQKPFTTVLSFAPPKKGGGKGKPSIHKLSTKFPNQNYKTKLELRVILSNNFHVYKEKRHNSQ